MTRRTGLWALLPLFILLLLPVPAQGAESFLTGNPSAEGKARGGADTALSRHALCMRTNPAGMGLIEGNREDAYGLALWNTLDYKASGRWNNGDAPSFGFNAGYVFVPSRLFADPFVQWKRRPASNAPYLRGGFIGHNKLRVDLRMPPSTVALRIRGIGFRVGEVAIRAEVAADRLTRTYVLPEPDPLGGDPVTKVTVKFQWRQTGLPGQGRATVNLKAYGRNRAILLGDVMGKWVPASIVMPLRGVLRPADFTLTVVGETTVEIGRVVVFRTVQGQKGEREVRTPMPDGAIRVKADEGLSTVLIDSTPITFDGRASLKDVFVAARFDMVDQEKVRAISVTYRYGFAGRGRIGKVELVVDGTPVAHETHAQPKVLSFDEERIKLLKGAVSRFKKDRFHVGAAVFTDAWLAADFDDRPTRVGIHEEQIRYTMFSASPAVAYRLAEGLAIGASVDFYYSRFQNLDTLIAQPTSILKGPGGTFGTTGDFFGAMTGNDAVLFQFDTDKLSAFGAGGHIGIIWEIDKTVAIGLSGATPSFLSRHEGEAVVDFTDDFYFSDFLDDIQSSIALPYGGQQGFEARYDIVLNNFSLPPNIALGVAVRPSKGILLAADVKWIPWGWSGKDHLEIKFYNGSNPDLSVLVGGNFTARIPFRFKDQVVVALGGSMDVSPEFTLHAGYRYASDPMEEQDLLPIFPIHINHHISLGVTYRIFTLEFHLAVTHGFAKTVEPSHSSHTSEWDGNALFAQENSLLLGVSYRY
jgi:long-subunit fatty acid transport protein